MILRRAFTLVELLIVIAIIGVLVALLVPAVQAARESARRASCQNNLKQLALAVQQYHDAYGQLPSLFNGQRETIAVGSFGLESHSWRTVILPQLEQAALHHQLDFGQRATSSENQPAVNHELAVVSCPSAPRSAAHAQGLWYGRAKFDETLAAATTDYVANVGYIEAGVTARPSLCNPAVTQHFSEQYFFPGAWGEVENTRDIWHEPTVRRTSFTDVTDGLSRTMLLFERAALPDQYFSGGQFEPHAPPQFRTWGNVGLWAISGEQMLNYLFRQTGVSLINEDNMLGLYAFHPGVAQVALADGSVQLLAETTAQEVVMALATRDGEESPATTP